MDFQVNFLSICVGLRSGNYDVFTSFTHERVAGKGDRVTPKRSVSVPKLFFRSISAFQEIIKSREKSHSEDIFCTYFGYGNYLLILEVELLLRILYYLLLGRIVAVQIPFEFQE